MRLFLLSPPRNVFSSKSERTNQNKIIMRKINSFVTGAYEAPSVKCFPMKAHEVICQSITLLYGGEGDPGSIGEDNVYSDPF